MRQDATRPEGAPPGEQTRLKRLRFRAWRRGFKEADLVLGRFADLHAAALAETDLARFEALLDEPDDEVYAWILGREPAPARHDHSLLALLQEFARGLHAAGLEPST
jgi:antitoxin CptB